ncbi:hypothetical protein DEAC_c39970 [Desulfosporosinus acididurans]|uniref:DUF1883 domain-containing protein n=1 Tax=Desulfosporosinus acididurans TaxID=476652 RepID=A0A0J1FM16_9FIRM|nr:DUF1883 domain-containing protein [Desulfosporosinus acididurans]KLU64003.1 hypothetical protein DEAC_c39970 [Desulfosporosinus acididurans]
MAQIPYADSNGHLTVKVDLKHAADVFLVDSTNFRRYESGQRFDYFGGHYTKTPVTISVQGSGRWYLIVNNNGEQYSYRFF